MEVGATSFWQSLVIQWRVVRALQMREIITRYGRYNIGFFWLFCEPALFCAGVMVIRKYMGENTRSLPLLAFVFTGYSTVLLWRNCANKCSCAITPSSCLLYHRNVRTLDILLSRIILELGGCTISFVVIGSFLITTRLIAPPEDWVRAMEGYLMEAWYAMSLGFWVCACSELTEVFDRFWHPMTYFMLPISGLGCMIDWLPLKWQGVAMMIPMWNAAEILRDGFFGEEVRCHYSFQYLVYTNLTFMLVGLALLKIYSRQAKME